MLYEFDHQHLAAMASPSAASDEELMALIQARDERALNALFVRHKALLRTIVSRVVQNDQDVDDVCQEVLLEIWNRAASYDEAKGKAMGWIVTLARRRAIDRVRRRQAYHRAEERNRVQVERESVGMHPGADKCAQESDLAQTLQQILKTIPAAQREALEMAYYQGLSQREIAAKTGIPLGTIKTRLELGVRKARAAVLAMGGRQEWAIAA
jgi:RNA polymerase sigma-70 factor (ECF subfamily)